jgi:hypothetical protein
LSFFPFLTNVMMSPFTRKLTDVIVAPHPNLACAVVAEVRPPLDFIPREIAAAGVDCESTGTPPAWLNGGAPRPLLYNGSRVRGAAMATRAAGRVFRAKKNPAAG